MKKFLKWFVLLMTVLIILPVLVMTGVVFFKPLLIINPKNLAYVLNKTDVFKSWSWKEARFSHERKALLHRNFEGSFKDFCFTLDRPEANIKSCFEELAWDYDLVFSFKDKLKATTLKPLKLRSSIFEITKGKVPKTEESKDPPDIQRYWNLLWASYVPDMDFYFQKIIIHQKKDLIFDLKLLKTEKNLHAEALEFKLEADPSKIVVRAPAKYKIPKDFGTSRPVYLKDFVLTAHMNDDGIPLQLEGNLEVIQVSVKSFIKLPLVGDLDSLALRKDVILNTKGEVKLLGLKESLRDYGPKPFNYLPAPLSSMNGNIVFKFHSEDLDKKTILLKTLFEVDLISKDQIVDLDILGDIPLNLANYSRGKISIGVNFHKLSLKLPRLSKKEKLPQFKPDGRFVKHADIEKGKKKESRPIAVNLNADDEDTVKLSTNLLDEAMRLQFDINITQKGISSGYVKLLPLKTKIFKRPIRVIDLVLTFKAPLTPVISATIVFPLPEYKITMNIEGPVDQPRYSFQSTPPLPESDIYAVLLFGRPMDDLSSEDRSSASRTNQVLTQGLLSLSTLYFLSGSPVEYIGYDPDSRQATAQIGLGRKNSLRIGGGGEGINSTAVRRSLGKGWYIDTSIQNTSSGGNSSQARDYGVLLERIIAY